MVLVKKLPASAGDKEMQVRYQGWKDPLEENMAIHFSILAWKISRTEEPGRLQSMRSQKSRTRLRNETTTIGTVQALGV